MSKLSSDEMWLIFISTPMVLECFTCFSAASINNLCVLYISSNVGTFCIDLMLGGFKVWAAKGAKREYKLKKGI